MYSRSFIVYRDYSNSLTLSNVGELSWGWSRAFTPARQGNVKKKKRHSQKEGNAWANSEIACVLSVLFTPLGEMISLMKSSSFPSTVFYVFCCIFHLGVVLDTVIWGSWSKNEPVQKFPRMTKKDKMRISCDSVSNVHWRSKRVKCHLIHNVLNTTARHDLLRIQEA